MKQKQMCMLFCMLIGLGSVPILAQSNTVASGGEGTGSGGTLSYTVGQLDYIEATGSGGSANQGVQHPYEIFVLGIDDFENIKVVAAVFPNPTINDVTLKISNQDFSQLSFRLVDISGRLVAKKMIRSEQTFIEMKHLSTSTYFLGIFENQTLLKTFKIIKH